MVASSSDTCSCLKVRPVGWPGRHTSSRVMLAASLMRRHVVCLRVPVPKAAIVLVMHRLVSQDVATSPHRKGRHVACTNSIVCCVRNARATKQFVRPAWKWFSGHEWTCDGKVAKATATVHTRQQKAIQATMLHRTQIHAKGCSYQYCGMCWFRVVLQ